MPKKPIPDAGPDPRPQPPQPRNQADAELERKLAELTPKQAELFVRALAVAMKKRRILLRGYLAAVVVLVLGLVWALYIYGNTLDSDEFMLWVFLVPPALAAIVLILFGRFARGVRG